MPKEEREWSRLATHYTNMSTVSAASIEANCSNVL